MLGGSTRGLGVPPRRGLPGCWRSKPPGRAAGARHGAVREGRRRRGRHPAPQPAGQRAEVTAGAACPSPHRRRPPAISCGGRPCPGSSLLRGSTESALGELRWRPAPSLELALPWRSGWWNSLVSFLFTSFPPLARLRPLLVPGQPAR